MTVADQNVSERYAGGGNRDLPLHLWHQECYGSENQKRNNANQPRAAHSSHLCLGATSTRRGIGGALVCDSLFCRLSRGHLRLRFSIVWRMADRSLRDSFKRTISEGHPDVRFAQVLCPGGHRSIANRPINENMGGEGSMSYQSFVAVLNWSLKAERAQWRKARH